MKYKNVTIPDNINFPVEEENAYVIADFNNPPYFRAVFNDSHPLESISIEGEDVVESLFSVYSCIFNPDSTKQKGVNWSIIEGSNYAYIDSTNGTLYLKSNANNSTVVIKAQSLSNSEIFDTKTITCTYKNISEEGDLEIVYDDSLVENGSVKEINVTVVDTLKTAIRLELYKLDNFDNKELVKSVEYLSSYTFSVSVYGENRYLVKSVFSDGTELVSDTIYLNAIPCCYIGFDKQNTWRQAANNVVNDENKINPTLDIASESGKEYSVSCGNNGDFLYIIVPVIQDHMQIDEIRMDSYNLSYAFDMKYNLYDISISGVAYKCYEITLDGNGFKEDNYRLLITK